MRSKRYTAINLWEAVEQPDGSWLHEDGDITWFNEAGGYHREDGPAVIYAATSIALAKSVGRVGDGSPEWFLNDRLYSFDGWCIKLKKTDEQKMMLRLQYG
jgi:hypothetical protein